MGEFELEAGEQITLVVRKHWIVLFLHALGSIGLAAMPIIIWFAYVTLAVIGHFSHVGLNPLMHLSVGWILFFLSVWWLFVWLEAATWFTMYYLTVWVITNTRIVEIHQHSFFSRTVSSFLLNRVQDVTTDVQGLLPTLFGFGTLNVETAGRQEKSEMYDIARPTELRDLIMREVAALHADGQMPQAQTGV